MAHPFLQAALLLPALVASSSFVAKLDPAITFRLPLNFSQNVSASFFATITGSSFRNRQLGATANASAVAFSQEFVDLFPPNASLQLVAQRTQPFAVEIGAWDCHLDQVWLTGPTSNGTNYLEVLDLESLKLYQPNTSMPIQDPNGGIYSNGVVYMASDGDFTTPPAVYSVDTTTLETNILVDYVANGIRANKEGTKLYITNTPDPLTYGANGTASSGIYVFDLDMDARPSNRRLFGFAERGISDGLHVDDEGRVWTGEADGIFVRDQHGRILGFVNAQALLSAEEMEQGYMLENFALAGDRLVIFAVDKVWVVKLAGSVVAC